MDKTNHGPCVVCRKPILYQGARFCGPACNAEAMSGIPLPAKTVVRPTAAPPAVVPVAPSPPEEPERAEADAGPGPTGWLSSLESPDD